MNPNIWGSHAWFFLHSITFGYPNCPTHKDKVNMKTFFNNLKHVLPCPSCRINYDNHLKKLPLTDDILNSKDKLITWLIDFHNLVNKLKGKKIYTKQEVMDYYNKQYKGNNNYILTLMIITIIFILLGLTYYIIKLRYY
jgi:hypothetical protein